MALHKLTYRAKEENRFISGLPGRLLEDGRDQTCSLSGKFLSGCIDKQIEAFEMAFPKLRDDMDCDAFEGFWF